MRNLIFIFYFFYLLLSCASKSKNLILLCDKAHIKYNQSNGIGRWLLLKRMNPSGIVLKELYLLIIQLKWYWDAAHWRLDYLLDKTPIDVSMFAIREEIHSCFSFANAMANSVPILNLVVWMTHFNAYFCIILFTYLLFLS